MVSPKVDRPSLGENDVQPIKPTFGGRIQKCMQGKVETDHLRLRKSGYQCRKHGVLMRALATKDLGVLRE